jgi:HD-GYP domain-containing protein (c-di-GMP phosphodiesterase class II)
MLGDNLYGNNGELLLSRGVELSREYIEAIKRLNYNGLYVDDDISRDVYVTNVINEKIRARTVKGIKDIFIHADENRTKIKKNLEETHRQIENIVDEILGNRHMMVNMVDMKVFDDYTYYHCVNVAVLAIALGVAMSLKRSTLCDLGFAAVLHDIGKVFIDKEILNKNGRLTSEEFDKIKLHSSLGCEYIKKEYNLPDTSYKGILEHHEKFGGGGYPNNKEENNISLFGRILAVADVYDALTSDRPYRKAMLPSEAMEYVMGSAITHFDPQIVATFVRKIAPYPVGTIVRLSNNSTGIVMENYEEFCLRPRLKIFEEYGCAVTPYELKLTSYEAYNITIVEVLREM